jgi:hypothetical protein
VEKIFENRTEKIKDYVIMGTKAQREYRIGDALRYYYWAYALWLSHPYRDEIKENVDGREILLGLLLQDRLNAIFSNIKFDVIDEVKNTDENFTKLLLHCSFNKHDVINIDYRYSIGGNVSALQEVENGFTEILLFDDEQNEIDKLRIGIEYKYINKSYHDKELSAVLNTVRIPFFKKSRKPVKIKSKQLNKAKYPAQTESPKYEKLNNLENSKTFYKKTINNLLYDIKNKNYEYAYKYFTPEGRKMFDELIKNGNVSVFPIYDTLKIININGKTMIRSIPMAFYFPNSNHQYVENVVFSFNEENKIEEISFAIDNITISNILNHGKAFGNLKDKYTLIKFMESYKTAYSLKRLNYIESIFSDNALIIVGTVLKQASRIEDMYKTIGTKAIRYQKLNKKEYIERLKVVFNSNEYINIDFDDAIVKKVNGNNKIYGIQIAQHYYSSSYNDFGYLFLMIDLNDSLKPTIYVRTWQPEKNPDGSIYGLEDFQMN